MFAVLKLISIFFSGAPKLPLILKVWPLPNIKNFSCDCQNEMVNCYQQQVITFLAVSLWKLQKPALSNVIPYTLYTCFSLSLFFIILVTPNKQFLNLKFLEGSFGQSLKS